MWFRRKERDLEAEHRAEAIRDRVSQGQGKSAVGDAVLGGVDGIITTFAIVSASAGANLPGQVVIILGIANLLADGFSMAVSNFLATRSREDEVRRAREDESWQIGEYPEGERRELREIFAGKGFTGKTLDRIVEVISGNRGLWVETMVEDELKLEKVTANPWTAATATFIAFLTFGFVPLVPYVLAFPEAIVFTVSGGLAAIAFILLGVWKGARIGQSPLGSGLQTLAVGGIAALLAYAVGALLQNLFGIALGG
jgi:vacuolar iron transporter family protein